MANFIFSPNNVKTILDAIDYFYMLQPALDELIDFSENIENSAEAVYNSIYDKLDSDGEFSFSEDEAFFIRDALLEYREHLSYVRKTSPSSSKRHKNAVISLFFYTYISQNICLPENWIYAKIKKMFILELVE